MITRIIYTIEFLTNLTFRYYTKYNKAEDTSEKAEDHSIEVKLSVKKLHHIVTKNILLTTEMIYVP
jgi:hypothetical protein